MSSFNTKILHELLYGSTPRNKLVRIFGCRACIHVHKPNWKTKFTNQAVQGSYIGLRTGFHHLYILVRRELISTKNASLDETQFPLAEKEYIEMDSKKRKHLPSGQNE